MTVHSVQELCSVFLPAAKIFTELLLTDKYPLKEKVSLPFLLYGDPHLKDFMLSLLPFTFNGQLL